MWIRNFEKHQVCFGISEENRNAQKNATFQM